jgi:hypothetical protein
LKSISKASVPAIRELETKVGLISALVLDYSIRVKSSIDLLSVAEDPFVTNLSTLISSILKLFIKLTLHYRLPDLNILSTRSKRASLLRHDSLLITHPRTQHLPSYLKLSSSESTREVYKTIVLGLPPRCLKVVDSS